jgi:hypothetical protein
MTIKQSKVVTPSGIYQFYNYPKSAPPSTDFTK